MEYFHGLKGMFRMGNQKKVVLVLMLLLMHNTFSWYDAKKDKMIHDTKLDGLIEFRTRHLEDQFSGLKKKSKKGISLPVDHRYNIAWVKGEPMVELAVVVDDTVKARKYLESHGAYDVGFLFTSAYFWFPIDKV